MSGRGREGKSAVAVLLVPLAGSRPCDFQGAAETKWSHCDCQSVAADAGRVFCRHVAWINIPKLPDTVGYRMTSLSIIQSGLIFIEGNSFRGQNIQLLDLSHNHILTLNINAFQGLESKLYQLSLNHNSLSAIPAASLRRLHQLQYLYLRHNHITHILPHAFADKQLKSLQFVYLDGNLISRLSSGAFSKLRLQVLTLGSNRITSIDPDALPKTLWFLNLKNNALDAMPLEALAPLGELGTLDLEGNNLTRITPHPDLVFAQPIHLLLSNNRISKLEPKAFSNFRNIAKLDLSYNSLASVPDSFLFGVESLSALDLSFNSLTTLPPRCFDGVGATVREVNLEENSLHTLPTALAALERLEKLNLANNKLTYLANLTFTNFKASLKELRLGFNSLSRVPTSSLEGMSRLHLLDLSANAIAELESLAFGTFDGAGTSLVRLNLAGNRLEAITEPGAFLYMSSLAYLDLSHNRIRRLGSEAFARLAGLESLFLHHNRLSAFPAHALSRLSKLRYLVLDENEISSLGPGDLDGLAQLEQLSLVRNRIYALARHSLPGPKLKSLKTLNLAHNRILHIASGVPFVQ